MSETNTPATTPSEREAWFSTLFASLVTQLNATARIMLGQEPHPETGKTQLDLDAAQLFIDQLEMLNLKTKGNLTPQEHRLLQQSLMDVRMGFVEAVEKSPGAPAEKTVPEETPPKPDSAETDEENRKRFSKKY